MDLVFKILGALGLIGIIVAVLTKDEKRQDRLFILGGLLLLCYSVFIRDIIFIILQIVFIAVALIELVQLSRKKSLWRRLKDKILK